MMPESTVAAAAEESRIRDAYARRRFRRGAAWFSPGDLFILQERERRVLQLFSRLGIERLRDKRILEIGCGTGEWLRDFVKWGARPEHLTGLDLLPDRLAEARRTCAAGVTLLCGNACAIDAADESFDLVLQSTVFTSILDNTMRRAVATEMMRVLRPAGLILWYDYHVDNPRNPDVRAVKKREIHQLFPGCRIELRRVTLAPPIARMLAPRSPLACHLLEAIPLLRTHYLGAIQKGRS